MIFYITNYITNLVTVTFTLPSIIDVGSITTQPFLYLQSRILILI